MVTAVRAQRRPQLGALAAQPLDFPHRAVVVPAVVPAAVVVRAAVGRVTQRAPPAPP